MTPFMEDLATILLLVEKELTQFMVAMAMTLSKSVLELIAAMMMMKTKPNL